MNTQGFLKLSEVYLGSMLWGMASLVTLSHADESLANSACAPRSEITLICPVDYRTNLKYLAGAAQNQH